MVNREIAGDSMKIKKSDEKQKKRHRGKWDTVIHVTEMPERRKDKIGQFYLKR